MPGSFGPYITPADVKKRVSADNYSRAFDWVGDGNAATIDANCTQCITDAESEINMCLGESYPGYLNDTNATVDPAIVSYEINVVLFHGVMHNPSAQSATDGPFLRGYNFAMNADKKAGPLGFFPRLAYDHLNRMKTASGGVPRPRSLVDNALEKDGVTYTNPWTRAADRRDPTGY